VRKRAYEVIRATNPNSLAMLELSRLAVIFGSDLGASSPRLKLESNRIVVSHLINYTEPEGLRIFAMALEEKKHNPDFEINWADLEPLCKSERNQELDAQFAVPDFQEFEHELRLDKAATLEKFTNQVIGAPKPDIFSSYSTQETAMF
jgi:hypothetical protein